MSDLLEFEKLIELKRVTKVVKGGRIMSFSALVVVSDGKNRVGFANAKGREVPSSMLKAREYAKKKMVSVNVTNSTIKYSVSGKHDASKVALFPAAPGTGIIASSTIRPVLEFVGIKDVLTKTYGSRNKCNVIIALFKALAQLKTHQEILASRA